MRFWYLLLYQYLYLYLDLCGKDTIRIIANAKRHNRLSSVTALEKRTSFEDFAFSWTITRKFAKIALHWRKLKEHILQTRPHKPHDQVEEALSSPAAASTYQAFGGDIQPEPLPNHDAVEKSPYSSSSSPQNPSLSSSGFLNPIDFSVITRKSSTTATTAARRYSRFENAEELERRVSTGSGSGGSVGTAGRGGATSFGTVVGDCAVSDVGSQIFGSSRSYAEARIKRASIYGGESSKKIAANSGPGGGAVSIGHGGSYTGGLDAWGSSRTGTVNGYDREGTLAQQAYSTANGNTAGTTSTATATGPYTTASCTSSPLRQRLASQSGASGVSGPNDLSAANPGIFVGGIGGSNIYSNNIQTPSTFNSSNLGVNFPGVAGGNTSNTNSNTHSNSTNNSSNISSGGVAPNSGNSGSVSGGVGGGGGVGSASGSASISCSTAVVPTTVVSVPRRQGSFTNVFSKIIDGMPAGTMFSKFKNVSTPVAQQTVIDGNPIKQYFDIGKQVACAGPELAWKIHEGHRKNDAKECSIFVFEKKIAEKLHKPRRKETITEILKNSVKNLERFRHPKMLQVIHTVEESSDTLAFATEPIMASLANILAFHESKTYDNVIPSNTGNNPNVQQSSPAVPQRPAHAKEYTFLDIELKCGFLQLVEAMTFLHYSGHVIHRNICPASIFITKRGTWKLGGLEFLERMNETDINDFITCQPWTTRISKMAQPNLDFMPPETQLHSKCSLLSDMFSLGLVICAVFNRGRPIMQSGNIPANYIKQLEALDENVQKMLPRVPVPLQEATSRLVNRDPTARPTAQLLQLIKYFVDPAVNALKFLDVVNMKDTSQKTQFYKVTLMESMPLIPKKLWWQNLWPMLQSEISNGEVLAAVLHPVLTLLQDASRPEYESVMAPTMKIILNGPKSIQATVTLLENLHLIIDKTAAADVTTDIMPMLFSSFESSTIQVQNAAVVAVTNVYDSITEMSIKRLVLPKVKSVFDKNLADPKIVQNVLICIESLMDRMDKPEVTEEILAILAGVEIPDPDLIMRSVRIYQRLFFDSSYGLTTEAVAHNVLPLLIPHTINPHLGLEQYCFLLEAIQAFLESIDRQQRTRLKMENLTMSSPERHRTLRHQYSTDNMNAIPPFNIPNLRIDQRKTSSAEDMARKNSGGSGMLGGWWFGCSPSSPDSNFLRVANAFPNRRLSDNTLMTPKIRIAPSCASSPGGTPGSGLPTRRHSSIGPQERRGSTINLSPPTAYGFGARGGSGSSLSVPSSSAYVGGSMPNTSSSVPFLLSSSMQSIRSRRTSTALSSGPLGSGSGLLQQLGSGMVRQFTSVSGTPNQMIPIININNHRQNVRKCPSLNITFSQ